jgi:hypothetical protein
VFFGLFSCVFISPLLINRDKSHGDRRGELQRIHGSFFRTPPTQKGCDFLKKKEISSKEKEIKKEVTRLNKIFKEIGESKKALATSLIPEAAFMKATLNQLKEGINKDGVQIEMDQGSYTILVANPDVKTYNTMTQRFTTVIKELNNLLPPDIPKIGDDGFDEFVANK